MTGLLGSVVSMWHTQTILASGGSSAARGSVCGSCSTQTSGATPCAAIWRATFSLCAT